jgi:hypothetical protein
MDMNDVVFAAGQFKIVQAPNSRFGVVMAGREVDWFTGYAHASKLVQDLTVSCSVHPDDALIGQRQFCPADIGNGNNVVVVARTKNGYLVQTVGTMRRFEVSADVLSEPVKTW